MDTHAEPTAVVPQDSSLHPAINRREALTALSALGLGALASSALAQAPQQGGMAAGGRGHLTPEMLGWDPAAKQYVLPKLKYPYDALEPHIDAQTMEIHHSKHHQGYVNGLNKAMAELDKIRRGEGDKSLIKHWSREVAFHGGGHVNHSLFWLCMAPEGWGGKNPSLDLASHISRDFGSFEAFIEHFAAAAGAVEGSGWAWLMYDFVSGRLIITQMEKQQNLSMTGAAPLLGIDVWEHAYYLKYQNKRADYVKAWFNVVNWAMVDELFALARGL